MPGAEQASIAVPAFALRRRGYDPDQVAKHLSRLDAEASALAADRAAAVEQAERLHRELSTCRGELAAARTEIDRLRGQLRLLAEAPETVETMDHRLQVMLRLARDEHSAMRDDAAAQAAAHTADIIATVDAEAHDLAHVEFDEFDGVDRVELCGPRDESGVDQLRRDAAAERNRLDEEAAARRAAADEEFRQVLTIRCREALAQLTRLQAGALRSARRMIGDADEQARTVLAEARESVRRTVDDAQREVDDLYDLRQRLAAQIDGSRRLLDGVMAPSATTASALVSHAPESTTSPPTGTPTGTNPSSDSADPGGPASPTAAAARPDRTDVPRVPSPRAAVSPVPRPRPSGERPGLPTTPPRLPARLDHPVRTGRPPAADHSTTTGPCRTEPPLSQAAAGGPEVPPEETPPADDQDGSGAPNAPGTDEASRAHPVRAPEASAVLTPSPSFEDEPQTAAPRRYP